MSDYSIENLIEIFKKNEIKGEMNRKKMKEQWRENNPDIPEPDHFNEDFNINSAFIAMCEQIQENKRRIERLQNE